MEEWRIGAINKEQSERYKYLCNDKQFSDHERRGACAWHQGLAVAKKAAKKAKPQPKKAEPQAKPQPMPKVEPQAKPQKVEQAKPQKWDLSFIPYPSRGGKYSENEYKKLNTIFSVKNDPNLRRAF